jgi:hypothetical protein
MLVVEQNANVSLSIADRGYVLSTGRVVLEGKAADLLENEDLRKAYLGRWDCPVPERLWHVSGRVGTGDRSRGDSGGSRSSVTRSTSTPARRVRSRTSVRAAYEEYLDGWDENGAEWEHWVERSEAARDRVRGVARSRADDVAIQTSVSAAVSGLVSALQFRGGAEPNRHFRERVPDDRADCARAGASRARGRAGRASPGSVRAVIDERTALVASTFVSFRTGAVHDVEAIYGSPASMAR